MKASIKFREEQKPLIRAKVPLSILNVPFQSGVVAGESKELTLNLGTLFDSGPSFKFSYRPNDSTNPFSFVFKTGIGHFGSPISSPFTMSAEFNLVGNQNPSFFIHFKPNFGDFCLKKSHSSTALGPKLNGVGTVQNGFETPIAKTGFFEEKSDSLRLLGGKVGGFPSESAVTGAVENLFSGTVVSARTLFPVRNRAVVNFRWGLRFPKVAAEDSDTVILGKNELASPATAGFSFKHCPLLVMNKISIEHVAKNDLKKGTGNADVAQVCLDVKQQLEAIQSENGLLRNALNDLRSEISVRKYNFDGGNSREAENSKSKYSGRSSVDRRSNSDKKSSNGKAVEGDIHEELKV